MKRAYLLLITMMVLLMVSCNGDAEQTEIENDAGEPVSQAEEGVSQQAEDEAPVGQETAPEEESEPAGAALSSEEVVSSQGDEGDAQSESEAETAAMATPIPGPPAEPQDVTIEAADDLEMVGTFYPGAGPSPWPGVMLLHMNGRNRQDWDEVARQLADSGYGVLAVDMRGHGETGGGRDWTLAGEDLLLVWDYLVGRDDVDEDNTAIVGASIGANMALVTTAAQPAVKTAILLSAGLDYFGVTTDDVIQEVGQRPVFLVASEDDPQAARAARELYELAPDGSALQMYDQAGHGTSMFQPQPDLVDLIGDWLDRFLKDQSEAQGAGFDASSSALFGTAWDDRAPFQAGLIDAEAGLLDQMHGASVYHMELTISKDMRSLTGRQEVRYTNQENEALDVVHFHLFPNILGGQTEISSVIVDDTPVGVEFLYGRSVLRVPLESPLLPGEQTVLQIEYQVDIPTQGGSNYGVFAVIDGVLALAHFYPQLAVYDDEGWNIIPPPENADVTYADAAFYLVRVRAPAEVTIVASGVEIERGESSDEQTVTYAVGPARDFYLAASEDYSVISQQVGQTTVNSYGFAQFQEAMAIALEVAVDALESFNERLGDYPYTEFDLAPTPNLALGVEYPGVVVIRSALYDPEAMLGSQLASFYLEGTVAHEVGHQWFYNTVGNDQLDEPWLDESLVQYLTYLYFLDRYGVNGGEGYRASFLSRWDRVDREQIPIGLPAGDYVGVEYSAIVYGRGPLFFEALAEAMGDETFASFLRDHYQRNKFGIATGQAIKALAEDHCGCSLDQLFAEWVG